MEVILDIETNRLEDPDVIWVAVCRDVKTGKEYVFERPDLNKDDFLAFAEGVTLWIGHNIIPFDRKVVNRLIKKELIKLSDVIDTLVISRLVNYSIDGGHSLEAWGNRFNVPKIGLDITDFSVYNSSLKERCIGDTYINLLLYKHLYKYIYKSNFRSAIETEQKMEDICSVLHKNGFPFNRDRALELRNELSSLLSDLDEDILLSFPPKRVLVKEFLPKKNKDGSWSQRTKDQMGSLLDTYTEGVVSFYEDVPFNPGSVSQIVDRLNEAGWKPTEKTKGHLAFEKLFSDAQRKKAVTPELLKRKEEWERTGWKVSEENLLTLPETAPPAARSLAERIIIASRLSDLDEWLGLAVHHKTPLESSRKAVQAFLESSGRVGASGVKSPSVRLPDRLTPVEQKDFYAIHGTFFGIGSWTHRMAHQKPNTANIPSPEDIKNPTEFQAYLNYIAKTMRSLFYAGPYQKLIGVDGDSIQMRIFAHYVNDARLINALLSGKKEEKTDIHSVHQRALEPFCRSRDAAKTFIYAFLLGAGVNKVSQILGCSVRDAREAVDKFLEFYPGLQELKKKKIPYDFGRGYFEGLDGRYVIVPDEHRVLAGYLQNGEKVIMARACVRATEIFDKEGVTYWIRNFVHDEHQFSYPDDSPHEEFIKKTLIESIEIQGTELNMNCPLTAQAKIGLTWLDTH